VLSIKVEGLSKTFQTTQALNGFSTYFRPGMMHGLIGPEGAGKTTLLRHLMGLLKQNAGTIRYLSDEKPVDFEAVRPNVAYMPQRQSLYADLSIEEHLHFFRDLYGLDTKDFKEKSERLLEITRLGKYLDRPAGKLSGGMYKKLGLMCALLASPQILLLDEPTNGVDPISRREFWELLYQLASEKILIIMATAYMDEAERCSEVHLIESGHIIGQGEPRELLQKVGARSFDEYFMKAEKREVQEHV
jgi:ABC-2 type transport system ATP-binding protein